MKAGIAVAIASAISNLVDAPTGAKAFIRNLRDEVIKGIYGRYRQGLYPHKAPIGYLDQGGGKPKIPDPLKAPLVKEAFELYASEAYNLDTLNRKMAMLGLCGQNGKALSLSSFASVFSNEFYMGIIVARRTGDRFQGIHEPLVTPDLFARVQQVLRRRKAQSGLKHDLDFRRLVRCCTCGYFLIGERQKSWVYYRCHTKTCPTNAIREDALEEAIRSALSRIALPVEALSLVQFELERLASKSAPERAAIMKRHKLALARLDEKLDRLTNGYLEGIIERPLYLRKQKEFMLQVAITKQELADSEREGVPAIEKVRKFLELQKSLIHAKSVRNRTEIAQVLKTTSSNCSVQAKKLFVDWKNGLDLIETSEAIRFSTLSFSAPRTADMSNEREALNLEIEKLFQCLIGAE